MGRMEPMTTEESTKYMAKSYGVKLEEMIELREKLSKLTGHATTCDIQVDPEWKPCTCGRG